MNSIDINCDMGESFGAYILGMDAAVLDHVTSANIACGWHAGDPNVMEKTIKAAKEKGVGIGAHPGLPDLAGFGRRRMDLCPEEIRQSIIYQVGALNGFCSSVNTRLQHIKPHGALYHMAIDSLEVAKAIVRAVASIDKSIYLVTLAGKKGEHITRAAEETGVSIVYEAFPDRAYTPDGTLVPRTTPGSVISDPDEVADRAVSMATEGMITATDGTLIPLNAQTLCVHGDTPAAVKLVKTIKQKMENMNIRLAPMSEKVHP